MADFYCLLLGWKKIKQNKKAESLFYLFFEAWLLKLLPKFKIDSTSYAVSDTFSIDKE